MHCRIEGAEEGKGYDEVRAIREKRGEMEEEVEGEVDEVEKVEEEGGRQGT